MQRRHFFISALTAALFAGAMSVPTAAQAADVKLLNVPYDPARIGKYTETVLAGHAV